MKQYANLIFLCCCMLSCKNENDVLITPETRQLNVKTEKRSLSKQDALNVAELFYTQKFGKETPLKLSRAMNDVEFIKGENNTLLAYVINYDEGGWAIVSATKDYYPILAYSDTLKFQLDYSEANLGLDIWIEEMSQAIKSSHELDSQASAQIALEWQKYTPETLSTQSAGIPTGNSPEAIMCRNRLKELNEIYSNDGWSFRTLSSIQNISIPQHIYDTADQYSSPYEYTIVGLKDVSIYHNIGPLITTTWGQDGEYNNLCPDDKLAGCVPIAMAQIMNFHQYPSTFDWANMQDNYATYASQYLIANIGSTIGVDYGYESTSSNISDAKDGFEEYGYNVIKKEHINSEAAFEIANYQRPIYMRGREGLLQLTGHAWVCDGLNQNISEYDLYAEYVNNGNYDNLGLSLIDNPDGFGGTSYTYFHMNWGWYGQHNGWFIDATPESGTSYNYDRENLYISVN